MRRRIYGRARRRRAGFKRRRTRRIGTYRVARGGIRI